MDRKITLLSSFTAMGLTTKELVEREKKRRETANARTREKVAAARRRGIYRHPTGRFCVIMPMRVTIPAGTNAETTDSPQDDVQAAA